LSSQFQIKNYTGRTMKMENTAILRQTEKNKNQEIKIETTPNTRIRKKEHARATDKNQQ